MKNKTKRCCTLAMLIAISFTLLQCNTSQPSETPTHMETDPALVIADATMDAMGGLENWNNTRHIFWDFFGRRTLLWDKWTGDVRIESSRDSMIYLVNINTQQGKVMHAGAEYTQPDSIDYYLDRAYRMWINDSYWLTMPFKLKDPGVTLKIAREDTTLTGVACDVLQLTFDSVGVTPNNKYEVYVDKKDQLVKQWAYFQKSEMDTAMAIWPWDNYQQYGDVLLSADRSDGLGPKDVHVYATLPSTFYTSFAQPDFPERK